METTDILNVLMQHGAYKHKMMGGSLRIHFTSDIPEHVQKSLRRIHPDIEFTFRNEKPAEGITI